MSAWTVYPEFLKKGYHVFRTSPDAGWCAVGPSFKNDFSTCGIGTTPQKAAELLLDARRGRNARRHNVTFADFTVHEKPIQVEAVDLPIDDILRMMRPSKLKTAVVP